MKSGRPSSTISRRTSHEVVPSSPLVPRNDPTLMFTNAGMVQFKNVFTGPGAALRYKTASTAQKCVRAGGKHNDLDNVGYTARHHTFFEMLGNFSFGDYFKERAIELAWNLITKEFGLDAKRLLVTVYHTDDDAYDLWKKIAGLSDDKIIRIATERQFLGDGRYRSRAALARKSSIDHGDHIWGGPPGSPEEDGDRFIEIWNLVFMQFEQITKEERVDLPRPSIDTRHGPRTCCRRAAGQARQLRYRSVPRADRGVGRGNRREGRGRTSRQPSRHRRPSAFLRLPDRRRRSAVERRPRLCASPHHAPRHAPCAVARREGTAGLEVVADAGAADGPRLS